MQSVLCSLRIFVRTSRPLRREKVAYEASAIAAAEKSMQQAVVLHQRRGAGHSRRKIGTCD